MAFCRYIHKGALALLIAVLLIAALLPAAGAASVTDFADVADGAWYYDAVSFVVSRNLFNGMSSTEFCPGDSMTRGMFITVLGRFAGVDPEKWCAGTITGSGVNLRSGPGTGYSISATMPLNSSVTILGESGSWYKIRYGTKEGYVSGQYLSPKYHSFSDVSYSQYYAGYAIWGYEKGIVKGMDTPDCFAPGQNVTREEICCFLNRYVSYAGLSLSEKNAAVTFKDQSSISSWALSDVTAMQRCGIVEGDPDGFFYPRSNATRAQAAAMFMRLYNAAGGSVVPTASPAPTATPAPQPTSGPGTDTPATFLSDKIAVKAETLRIGLYVSTNSYATSVKSVTLANTNGTSFEYGTFSSDRTFKSSGTISSSSLTITTDGSRFTVKNASGTAVYTTTGNLAIHPVSSSKAITRVNGEYRYYGDFELRQAYNRSGYITVINYVNIDDYVKGVIPYEYSTSWPAETLKAAAITARNFAMTSDWSAYSSFGFDMMGNNGAQTYYGRSKTYSESYFSATDAAVNATANVYLTYKYNGTNRLCSTYYFSSDGGATEDSAHVWGGSYSYLTGKPDPYEAAASSQASNYTYTIRNSRTGSTMTALATKLGLSTIAKDGIKITTYPATGNVKSITITDTRGKTATISQSSSFTRWNFLSYFGFTAYSYNFKVTYDASSDSFSCTRYGWGHNVGLSQWGAYAMARYYNKTYQDILGFYYDGTHLQYGVY